MENLTATTSTLLDELFAWWRTSGKGRDPSGFLAPGFLYDGLGQDAELWIWLVKQGLDWQELLVIDRVVHGDQGVLVFEGIDPVTLLRHRVAWRIEVSAGRIIRLVDTSEIVS